MNRRKKIRLVCISVVLLFTASYVIYSLVSFLFNSLDRDKDLSYLKLDSIKLAAHIHSTCACRRELIRIHRDINNSSNINTKNERLRIDVITDTDNSTILKSYAFVTSETSLACRAYESLRRGPNQRVISYSVYGNNSLYRRYLQLIARTAKKIYPGWVVRFYHDGALSHEDVCNLECLQNESSGELLDNVDVCNVNEIAYRDLKPGAAMIPTFWRWLPIGDDFVDVFLSRDSDFCVVERDREAVDDWIQSGSLFHVMRGKIKHYISFLKI